MSILDRASLPIALLVAGAVSLGSPPAARAGSPDESILLAKKKKKKKPKLKKGMEVVAKGETSVMQSPDGESDELYTIGKGEKMTIVSVSDDGDWVRVKDSDGAKGWVAAKSLKVVDDGGDDEAAEKPKKKKKKPKPEPDPDEEDGGDDGEDVASNDGDGGDGDGSDGGDGDGGDEGDGDGGDEGDGDDDTDGDVSASAAAGAMRVSVGADLAFLYRTQDFTSPAGTGIVGKSKLSNGAPALRLDARVWKPVSKYLIGAEGCFLMSVGGDGISVEGEMEPLSWDTKALDLRVAFAYPMPKYTIAARAGYRIAATSVEENLTVKLPSERVSGVVIGAELALPELAKKIGARVGVETMLGAELIQNDGRKDGDSASISAFYLNVGLTYMLGKNLDAMASYALGYESYEFTGPSERQMDASDGSRSDLQHVIAVGIVLRR